MAARERKNPFFTLLMIVSTLFVITTLGYLVGPFVEQRAIDGNGATAGPLSTALARWFERRGVIALAIEFAAMFLLAILSMATDHFFDSKQEPRAVRRTDS